MHAIATEHLTKRYGRRLAIDDLTLTVPEGVIYGFLGPNGSGKTTTIRLLLGFLRPSSGGAAVFGRDCWGDSVRVRRAVGYLAGDVRLYPWFNLAEAVRIVKPLHGAEYPRRAYELAEYFELEPDVRVRKMSRGMRQKLGLILALAHYPKLLVLDEPSSALDPPMQQALYTHLRERAADGATVFFSSHTLGEVENLCEQVAILREGRLIADERLSTLRESADRSVRLVWKNEHMEDVAVLPAFLELHERQGRAWLCGLRGPVMEFVRWSAEQPLEELEVGAPDLDSLFRRFYADREKLL